MKLIKIRTEENIKEIRQKRYKEASLIFMTVDTGDIVSCKRETGDDMNYLVVKKGTDRHLMRLDTCKINNGDINNELYFKNAFYDRFMNGYIAEICIYKEDEFDLTLH